MPRPKSGPAPEPSGVAIWTLRTVLLLASVTLLCIVAAGTVVDPLLYIGPPRVDPPSSSADAYPPCPTAHATAWRSRPMTDAELERMAQRRWLEFRGRLRDAPLPRTDQALRDHVDAAFEPVYARIPEFLDWHYSVAGQYTQLGQVILDQLEGSHLARAAFERLQSSQLAQAVLDRLGESSLTQAAVERLRDSEIVLAAVDQLRQGVDARLFGDLPDRIGQVSDNVERAMKEEVNALIERRILDEVRTLPPRGYVESATPCPASETPGIGIAYEGMLRAAIPQTLRRFTNSAAPTGIVAAGAALSGAAAAGALVRGLSRRVLFRTAGRTARALGAAVGGLAAGTAAWLLVDTAVLFVDEHFNRDDLEREITELVDEQKAEIKSALSRAVGQAKSEALGEFTPSQLSGRD